MTALRLPDRAIHPRVRLALNLALLAFVLASVMFWFNAYLQAQGLPGRVPFLQDARTYLAAAERIHAGQPLYEFWEGDPPLVLIPGVTVAPLLSPPPIAAFWQVLAALPFGFELWVIAAWVATLGAVIYICLKAPLPGIPLAFALSFPLGEQLFGANATAFVPAFYILAWRFRASPWIGVLIAALASVKLAPLALAGWLLGTRRYRALVVTIAALGALFVLGGVLTGFESYAAYLSIIPGSEPSSLSISGITGIRWASYAVLGLGTLLAIVIGRRWDGPSYMVAVVAAVLGTPALFPAHFAALLALAAPFADRERPEPRNARIPVATRTSPAEA